MKVEREHSFVVIEGSDDVPREIILRYDDSVIVLICYLDPYQDWIERGCELVLPLDQDGDGLMRMPFTAIKRAYDDATYATIMDCLGADNRLLSYAH